MTFLLAFMLLIPQVGGALADSADAVRATPSDSNVTLRSVLRSGSPGEADPPVAARRIVLSRDRKSPARAVLYAVASTAVPIAGGVAIIKNVSYNDSEMRTVGGVLIGAGALIGPSMGNFYAGDGRRGGRGVLLRLGGGALMLGGLYVGFAAALGGEGSEAAGAALFLGGAVVTGVSAL